MHSARLKFSVYDEDTAIDDVVGIQTFTFKDVAATGYATGPFDTGVVELKVELRQP